MENFSEWSKDQLIQLINILKSENKDLSETIQYNKKSAGDVLSKLGMVVETMEILIEAIPDNSNFKSGFMLIAEKLNEVRIDIENL